MKQRFFAKKHSEHDYRKHLTQAAILIIGVNLLGTTGYYILENDWTLLDAFYMTVITITTVGYGETHQLTPNGRIFTILLLFTSVGSLGYAISTVASFILEGHINHVIRGRKMDKRLAKLNDHVILCGGGRTGRHIAMEFYKTHVPFVVIEQNEDVLQHIHHVDDIAHLLADATEDETLLDAGITRARGLIAALGDDKDNVFIVLSGRSLNPTLRIIARANEEENEQKFIKAGANYIVSPNAIGGLRMASIMIRPSVVSFLDEMMRVPGDALRFDEISLVELPLLDGLTLAQADIGRKTGLLVVAIRSPNGDFLFNPGAKTVLRRGDLLIVLGTRKQLNHLREVLASNPDDLKHLLNETQRSQE